MLDGFLLPIGIATAKAVARIWIKSDVALDISDALVDRLASRVPALTERRRTARQFQDMADRIAGQLTPLIERESQQLPENELIAAVHGVADLIDSMQGIDPQVLFLIDLEPSKLESLLRSQPRYAVRDELAGPDQLMFDRLLRENCHFIVELVSSMPDFQAVALGEVLKRETEIIDRVKDVLAKIPQPSVLQADADQEFDLRYRRHIAHELDALELFGLNLDEKTSRYDLSIAYITLSAAQGTMPVLAVESEKLAIKGAKSGPKPKAEDEPDMRVDEALSRNARHLIRGEAGSGKTTLLRWLAVTAARSDFEDDLDEWNSSVPFFIQLRRYANTELPRPEEFISHVASTILGLMPPGWVHRQLESGRALVLIDGVDELPERQRSAARKWLYTLLDEYPDCRYVITTRPPAVPSDWLQGGEFGLFELLPMAMADIVKFVTHWHDAARSACAYVDGEDAILTRYQAELIRLISGSSTIRNLATTPLLCAMLCALNRERRTQLPRDRMELYRVALESLLERRDTEREISQNENIRLSLREKQSILENLAYWLVRNGQSDVATADAVQHISDRLAYMSSVRGSAEDVFRYLLTRSGLIREPVAGRVDFIHRTFQEYLAASRAVSQADIPFLVQNAHDDSWREVVILSAGHANESQCDALLMGLLQRGKSEAGLRHRLHLLAVACLETAVELSPSTRHAVEDALRGALPPTNMTDARAVASAGPLAAPLLRQYGDGLAVVAAACVRALCLIGDDEALSALESFRSDTRRTVQRELLRGWDSFDRFAYAERILSSTVTYFTELELNDLEKLAAVAALPEDTPISFEAPSRIKSLERLPNLDRLNTLILHCPDLDSLDGIQGCVNLRRLELIDNQKLLSIEQVPESISYFHMTAINAVESLARIPELKNLRTLTLAAMSVNGEDLVQSSVQRLSLNTVQSTPFDGWVSSLFELEQLTINVPSPGSTATSLGWLSGCLNLKELMMWFVGEIRSLDGMPPGMTSIHIQDVQNLVNADAVSEQAELTHLMLDGAINLDSFGFLSGLGALQSLDLERTSRFSDLKCVPHKNVEHLNVGKTGVRDLEELVAFVRLSSLVVDSCPIESFEPLRKIGRRMSVTISRNQTGMLDDELRARHNFRIVPDA